MKFLDLEFAMDVDVDVDVYVDTMPHDIMVWESQSYVMVCNGVLLSAARVFFVKVDRLQYTAEQSTVQYCIAQHSIVHFSTAQHSTEPHSTAPHN